MAAIDTHSTLTTGLVSYYPLSESNGKRFDVVGSNHLTEVNSVPNTSAIIGNGADFTAANSERLTVGTPVSTATTNISMNMWVYINDTSEQGCFFSNGKNDITYSGYQLGVGGTQMNNNGNNLIGLAAGVAWFDFGDTIGTGWHMVTMTRGASTWKGYIDGVVCTNTYTTNPVAPTTQTGIGWAGGTSNPYYFDGAVDEVGFWEKELSQSEIDDLYNSGNGLPYSEGIMMDDLTNTENSATNPQTFSHTCTGSDRALLIAVYDASNEVTGITYNGVSMTRIINQQRDTTSNYYRVYYLLNPASGTNTVSVSRSGTVGGLRFGTISYTGVHQTSGIDTSNSTSNTTNPASLSVTTTVDDCWLFVGGGLQQALTPSSGAIEKLRTTNNNVTGDSNGSSGTAGSKTVTWSKTAPTAEDAYGIVALAPSFVGGATATTPTPTLSLLGVG